jgi:flagellar basal-body rod modification protein FlgD
MSISPLAAGAAGTSTPAASSAPSTLTGGVSEQQFFQLLSAELANQDPTQPVDSTQFITQLASFAQLSALTAMQSDLASLAGAPILNGAALLGKTVTTASGSGLVEGASVSQGVVTLQVHGLGGIPLSAVTAVS